LSEVRWADVLSLIRTLTGSACAKNRHSNRMPARPCCLMPTIGHWGRVSMAETRSSFQKNR